MPGPKYGEFSFPASAGFHGEKTLLSEAGKTLRMARGGGVKKAIGGVAKMAKGVKPVKAAKALGALGQMASMPDPVARAKRPGTSGPVAYAKGGKVDDAAQDKKMVTKGVHQHESALHKGQPKTALKLARGGFNRRPLVGED